MREERLLTPARFLALLNDYFWRASQFYSAQHLREFTLPKVSRFQESVMRISAFAYGLISIDAYDRAYLSELNNLINEFVREYEEILDCSNCSDEAKMEKLENLLRDFSFRLSILEDEVKKEYIIRTLEDYLKSHSYVLGKDFTLKDLYYLLGRIVDLDEDEDEESPLNPA